MLKPTARRTSTETLPPVSTSDTTGNMMPAPTSKWPNFKLTKAQNYLVNVIDDADKTTASSSKVDPLQLNPNPNAAQSAREIFMAKLKAQAGGIALFPKGNMYVSKGDYQAFIHSLIPHHDLFYILLVPLLTSSECSFLLLHCLTIA